MIITRVLPVFTLSTRFLWLKSCHIMSCLQYAMLQRVLFLGHNLTTRDVCNHVLSACLLISPPIFG